MSEKHAYTIRRLTGSFSAIGVPIRPSIAPKPYPSINKNPFVAAGAIGKVNSDAKFIEIGMIGTKKMPKKTRVTPTTYTYNFGMKMITHKARIVTPVREILRAKSSFYVFCRTIAMIKLESTPNTVVRPPYAATTTLP